MISLSELVGKRVVDVRGHVTEEFIEPTFQMFSVLLEDGTEFFCEGAHDLPYLTEGSAKMPELPVTDD